MPRPMLGEVDLISGDMIPVIWTYAMERSVMSFLRSCVTVSTEVPHDVYKGKLTLPTMGVMGMVEEV